MNPLTDIEQSALSAATRARNALSADARYAFDKMVAAGRKWTTGHVFLFAGIAAGVSLVAGIIIGAAL